ncbi:uncharacterized protein [Gossypium hirsutum]|uniref:Gag-Pol polyprotein n=1 Tax=Gossypium hirsutum TaxID=3635 RepID=A0ABM2ZDD6_GOSHI|nr:uncharacterized protein LOC121212291 [Gossypium hirsutum]
MCKCFEEGLNEDIKLLIGILDIREFAVLVDRAKKVEELNNEKKQAERKARVQSKRFMVKTYTSPTKKSRSHHERSNSSVRYSGKIRASKRPNLRSSSLMTTSVGSVGNQKPQYNSCNKFHFRECQIRIGACYRCSSLDHFLKDCLEQDNKEESTAKSEARAPVKTYAIRAGEEASAPDVITGTFSLDDIPVVALIYPRSTHSYVCMTLVSSKKLPVESTEGVIRVSNLLGKQVLVDKKVIELRCGNGETLWVESDESCVPSVVIPSMSTQKCLKKGCEAYLANVLNTKESELKVESVPVICEYPNVFLEELPGLPPI